MWKLIGIIIAIIFFAIFFIQNMVKIPVRFIATEPVNLRLTYVIIVTFAVGYLSHGILYVAREASISRRKKRAAEAADDDDDDDDDDFLN